MSIDYNERIPNNVDLSENKRLQRALEAWQPELHRWWRELGPEGLQENDVYLRTAISVDEGLGALRLREDAGLPLGHLPGRRRSPARSRSATTRASRSGRRCRANTADARRLIVTQGDTEPASVEQQRHLGRTCPRSTTCATCSRSTSRRAATSGPWCTCCTPTSGATAATRPRRCSSAAPAIPTSRASSARSTSRPRDWLSFFMFTFFTDRDGKYQLAGARRDRLRSALAHLSLHADRGGPPHVRRRDRRQPRRAARLRADA